MSESGEKFCIRKSSGYFRSNHHREKLETLSPKRGRTKNRFGRLKNKSRKTAISAIHYMRKRDENRRPRV